MGKSSVIFLILVLIASIFLTGCTQSPGSVPVTPTVPATSVPAPEPALAVPAAATASAPQEVVTIVRYVSPLRDIKDSGLLFTLQVPVEWNVSTYRLTRSDTSDYRTDLVAGNVFSIYSYFITRSREQEYRDQFREQFPAPVETTVTINGIRYDRFEKRTGGNTSVAYIARTNCANERGYAVVLVFTARDNNRFEREDFEKVVSSFRYVTGKSAVTDPGEEIPLYDTSGNAVSRTASVVNMTDGGSSGDDLSDGVSSGGSTSGGSSSGGSSSGGGSCHG